MHFCLLQRASASKGSGHHHRTQESWFRTSDKNKHLWPLQCFLQWSSGHCYSTRQRPGPDKSGHGCLLCLPEGQSSFYLFIFGLLEKDIRVGEEKKKRSEFQKASIIFTFPASNSSLGETSCSSDHMAAVELTPYPGFREPYELDGCRCETLIVPPRIRYFLSAVLSVRRMQTQSPQEPPPRE